MEELYNLKLGGHYVPNNNEDWFRVPGGWIYTGPHGNSVFVPFDNEFQNTSSNSEYKSPSAQLKNFIRQLEENIYEADKLHIFIDRFKREVF